MVFQSVYGKFSRSCSVLVPVVSSKACLVPSRFKKARRGVHSTLDSNGFDGSSANSTRLLSDRQYHPRRWRAGCLYKTRCACFFLTSRPTRATLQQATWETEPAMTESACRRPRWRLLFAPCLILAVFCLQSVPAWSQQYVPCPGVDNSPVSGNFFSNFFKTANHLNYVFSIPAVSAQNLAADLNAEYMFLEYNLVH